MKRCEWACGDALMERYHDEEWGVPLHDDGMLFEYLVLDAMQAGLSWLTVLRKREAFRAAFDGFDPARVAAYGDAELHRLLGDAGIVRNRAKIGSAISNAGLFMGLQREHGSFDAYIWRFVGGRPIRNAFATVSDIPAQSEVSRAMSRELTRRGFSFVGPTICYAFMQAAGMVNDHTTDCFRYDQV